MNINELNNEFINATKTEKLNLLSHISDIFESYTKINSFRELVELLIKYAIDEKDEELKFELLDTISRASEHRTTNEINFDILEENIDLLSIDCLELAIDILSFSHNNKYIKTIKKYILHENKKIAYVANIALEEINGK